MLRVCYRPTKTSVSVKPMFVEDIAPMREACPAAATSARWARTEV